MKQIVHILIIMMILFLSCEKDADIKLPEEDPKLSVYGFISPEDTITSVVVKKTKPFYDKKNNDKIEYITNAQVKITNEGTEYILPFSTQTNSYYLDSNEIKIIPGEEYFIEISAQDLPVAISSTVIPVNINKTLEFIDIRRTSNTDEIYFNVKWTDNSEEKNYYRLTGYADYETDSLNYSDNEYYGGEGGLDDYNIFLYDDADWNGQTKTSDALNCYVHYTEETTIIPVHLMLLNIDYHYYQYHKTVRDFDFHSGDPFSEPVIVYSNIQNGAGVFASYRKYKIITNLEVTSGL